MNQDTTMNVLKSHYQILTGKAKTNFRLEVMDVCDWKSESSFRLKLHSDLKKIEIEAIKKIIPKYK